MSDRVQTLLAWSSEYSASQPDLAALLARAASLLLTRTPKQVINLHEPQTVTVQKLPPAPRDFRMTRTQREAMRVLAELPGLIVKDLAAYLSVTPNATYMVLNQLQDAGFVKSENSPLDGRNGVPPKRWFLTADKAREDIA